MEWDHESESGTWNLDRELTNFPQNHDWQHESWKAIHDPWSGFKRYAKSSGKSRSKPWSVESVHESWSDSWVTTFKNFKTFPHGQFHPFLTFLHLNYEILASPRREYIRQVDKFSHIQHYNYHSQNKPLSSKSRPRVPLSALSIQTNSQKSLCLPDM